MILPLGNLGPELLEKMLNPGKPGGTLKLKRKNGDFPIYVQSKLEIGEYNCETGIGNYLKLF